MALIFFCPNCHHELTVQFLQIGEKAQCKQCGATVVVPPTAQITDKKPLLPVSTSAAVQPATQAPPSPNDPPIVMYETDREAWNPTAILWIGALFSLLPAGLMWSFNWERLGYPQKKWPSLINTILLFAAYVLAVEFIPNLPRPLFHLVNGAVSTYFYKTQHDHFKTFLARGGTKKSLWLPVSICTVSSALVLWAILSAPGDFDTEYDSAVQLISEQKYPEAVTSLLRLEQDYPDEPGPYYSLAYVYNCQDKIDSALQQIRKHLDLAHGGQDGLALYLALHQRLDSIKGLRPADNLSIDSAASPPARKIGSL